MRYSRRATNFNRPVHSYYVHVINRGRIIQGGQKSVPLFSRNLSKMLKDMKKKLLHLKEIRLRNYMMPFLWKSFNRTDVAIIISKMRSMRLFFICGCTRSGQPHTQGTSERATGSWRPPSPRCLLELFFYKFCPDLLNRGIHEDRAPAKPDRAIPVLWQNLESNV